MKMSKEEYNKEKKKLLEQREILQKKFRECDGPLPVDLVNAMDASLNEGYRLYKKYHENK